MVNAFHISHWPITTTLSGIANGAEMGRNLGDGVGVGEGEGEGVGGGVWLFL
jgi:hypothetical protein